MVNLSFQLEVADGWPPVSVENLQCTPLSKGFQIDSIPLFVKGLSVGDIISTIPDEEGRIWEWSHIEKSNRTTIWLGRLASGGQAEIDTLLLALSELNCNSTGNRSLGCFAIDVPPECLIQKVDSYLESLSSDQVAVVFPSFRLDE
jgi:hypothetical protein